MDLTFKYIFIEVQLIYNFVLISAVQQSDYNTHVCVCVCVCVCLCWGWGQQNVFHGFQGGTHMTEIAGSLSETLLLGQGEYTSETCRPMPEVQPMVSL